MIQKIITQFLNLTKISHCSKNTKKIQEYIASFAKEQNYEVKKDKAGNLLVSSQAPKVCFQAHLDMVCVGEAPKIEPIIEKNIIKAKNSSLGADNAIAIAMMLTLMEEKVNAEFLFTNDEEIGLIGAKNLDLQPKSSYLLNLDSEEEGEIYIGCAGGIDVFLEKELKFSPQKGYFYEILISNLPGGHSGVDIDKNIPNAIIELAKFIKKNNCKIVSFEGGERINSIPANAKAIVWNKKELRESNLVKVKKLDKEFEVSDFDIDELLALPNGVLEKNKTFSVVESSANLAIVEIEKSALIKLSLRSLDNEKLETLAKDIEKEFSKKGFNVILQDKYPGWKPEINEFTNIVKKAMEKVYQKAQLKVIHAGLECGILSEKLPYMKMASIGPTIKYPHSLREYVEIPSIGNTFNVIKEVLRKLS